MRKLNSSKKSIRTLGRKKVARSVAKSPVVVVDSEWFAEYLKYFVAPANTPEGFRVLDLTDDSPVTTSSHT